MMPLNPNFSDYWSLPDLEIVGVLRALCVLKCISNKPCEVTFEYKNKLHKVELDLSIDLNAWLKDQMFKESNVSMILYNKSMYHHFISAN